MSQEYRLPIASKTQYNKLELNAANLKLNKSETREKNKDKNWKFANSKFPALF